MDIEENAKETTCYQCSKTFTDGQRIVRDEDGRCFCSTRCALIAWGASLAKLPPE